MKLELCSFTAEDFHAWKGPNRAQYAREKEKEGLTPEDAQAEAERSFATLLPQEEKAPDHFLYSVVEKSSGSVVGDLWWAKRQYGTRQSSWIYNIMIRPAFRGQGYGRETMELAMQDIRAKGIGELGLHVFGHNEVAQKLYRSLGFHVTNVVMQRNL